MIIIEVWLNFFEVRKMFDDTIAAIATAYGPAGVGIIRISGADAAEVADRVFKAKSNIKLKDKKTHNVTYGYIIDKDGELIDEALALTMWSPYSFTGEDIVELQCHGGMVILKKVLDMVLREGARLAEPGEFSKRAFLNGRLDLSQAEAIMDLVNAKTETAVNIAANNLHGDLSAKIKESQKKILEIIAYLEADIDFPEEDFARLSKDELIERMEKAEQQINKVLNTFSEGRIIREGLKIALIGKPNVGKSSLLNTILKTKRAIVTDIPGTTRDIIEEYYNLGGIPLVLIDTAGIRATEDVVEKMGVAKSLETIQEADLILYLFDLAVGFKRDDEAFLSKIPKERVLILVNKVDLLTEEEKSIITTLREKLADYRVLFISATAQIGIGELEEEIKKIFFAQGLEVKNEVFLTNIRHKTAIEKAYQSLDSAKRSVIEELPSDFISIDLKNVLNYLGEVTGETLDEDIIDEIFSQFCLGK